MLDNYVKKLIDDLNAKIGEIKPQLQEIKEIYSLLQEFKKRTGAPFEIPDLGWLIGGQADTRESTAVHQTGPVIRPDSFYGKSITEAAEEYLKPIRHAVSGDEIFTALTRGGLLTERKSVNDTLTRAVRKFKKFGTGSAASFGLIEWYPKKKSKAEELLSKIKEIEDQDKQIESSPAAEEDKGE
jgi:hypothetical protein